MGSISVTRALLGQQVLENRVLGCMIASSEAAALVLRCVSDEWFADTGRRKAFMVWSEYVAAGKMLNGWNAQKELEAAGGLSAMVIVSDATEQVSVVTPQIVEQAISDLRSAWMIGVVQRAGSELGVLASRETDPEALRRTALDTVVGLLGAEPERSEYVSPDSDDAWWEQQSAEKHRLIPFPFDEWNQSRGGYSPGEIVVIGAHSGHGKSWLGLQYLMSACRSGYRCYYASLEMTHHQLYNRMLAMGGHRLNALESRHLKPAQDDPQRVLLRSLPYTISEGRNRVADYISAQRLASIQGKPYDVMFVDHTHLLDVPGRDYRLGLNKVLAQLKSFATREHVAVVLLAQLRRNAAADTDPQRPRLSDLKETSALEQIADYVTFLHRKYENGSMTLDGEYFIAKQRQGAWVMPLDVSFDTQRFQFTKKTYLAGIG